MKGCVYLGVGKSREEIIRESMNAPKKIDTNVSIKINYSPQQFDSSKHKYKCSCCGKGFNTQKSNFHKTNSPLFQANDGYLPWCCECEDKFLIQLTALFSGNEEHAIEFYCHTADWVYDFEVLKQAREISSDRSRISHYSAKKNLNVDGRKTYTDSLKFDYETGLNEIIQSKDEIKTKDVSVTGTAIDRWGGGLKELDYSILEDHYKMLKKNNPNCDNNQEIFIKSLCNLNWLMAKMLRAESCDSTKYTTLVEQYSKTFKQAGLKTVAEKDSSNDETFCMTLGFISDYTPEEFYLNKDLYKDNDNLGDYVERHITRPMINLETGSTTRDTEYFVPDGDEYDEE
jgi:hypothetical protein